MCDNCKESRVVEEVNAYDEIFKIISGFKDGITFNQLVDTLTGKGGKKKKFVNYALEGILKDWKAKEVENLIKELIF